MPLTDKDTYIKRFSELKYGAPLYRPSNVQLGDVGFIDEQDGFFQKLYNIASPPTDLGRGCPPPVEIEKITHTEAWDAIHLKKTKGFGASFQVNPVQSSAQMKFSFSHVKSGECILIPGKVVVIESLEKAGRLPKYMNDHYKWIAVTFGGSYRFSPGSIILVVRTVKTDHWAITVNTSSEVVNDLSFSVSSAAGATLWGQWSRSGLISRRGPGPIDSSATDQLHPAADRGPDQTLFVRRIALRPPVSFFGQPEFNPSIDPSPLERFRATIEAVKQDWWLVENTDNSTSLPAAASGVSDSVDVGEESDSKNDLAADSSH